MRELPACRQRQARVRPALLRPNARLALARRGAHKRLQECRPQGHQRLPPLRVPHRHCIGHTAPCATFAAKSDGTRQLATSVADATFEKGGMMAGRCVERTDTSCGAASSAECVDIKRRLRRLRYANAAIDARERIPSAKCLDIYVPYICTCDKHCFARASNAVHAPSATSSAPSTRKRASRTSRTS